MAFDTHSSSPVPTWSDALLQIGVSVQDEIRNVDLLTTTELYTSNRLID